MPSAFPHEIDLEVASFDGAVPRSIHRAGVRGSAPAAVVLEGTHWSVRIIPEAGHGSDGILRGEASFEVLSGEIDSAGVALRIDFPEWSVGHYVLMPAGVYGGNRFRCVPKRYPPMLHSEDGIGPSMPVTITDVPRLSDGEGDSRIHLRSGDLATPCAAVFSPSHRRGFILLFDHVTAAGYTGVSLTESADRRTAVLRVETPAVRAVVYRGNRTGSPSDDEGSRFTAGDRLLIGFTIHDFSCPDIPSLYRKFLELRKERSNTPDPENTLPFSAAFAIIEEMYHREQWNGVMGYWRVGTKDDNPFEDWQAGWVGGGMNSLALLSDGSPESGRRSVMTMDAVFGPLQASTGFIYPIVYRGKVRGDDFCHPEAEGVSLIRKNADLLLFAARHILLMRRRGKAVPPRWIDGFTRLADAFAGLWERHGQFGQFVDILTGEILQGGTASGSSAPGGLALAAKVLGNGRYADAAVESAEAYYAGFVAKGIMNGGPGEILQCPDSESAFNMLESFTVLHAVTGDPRWIRMAEDCAAQCASWCVSYDFRFPADSVFGRLGMRTTGSVYANVQNKHSAPGICTLSGASLLRLYRATGNGLYLDLCRDIAHGITQYLSRADRPVESWDGRTLPPGWMCERVNMSDWEGKDRIGGVFHGTCWCAVSCLLTCAEIPGVLFDSGTGDAVVFDHVRVDVEDRGDEWELVIENPTAYDARVKVFVESASERAVPLEECYLDGCPAVEVAAGGRAVMCAPKTR